MDQSPTWFSRITTMLIAAIFCSIVIYFMFTKASSYYAIGVTMLITPIFIGLAYHFGAEIFVLAGMTILYSMFQNAVGRRTAARLTGLDQIPQDPELIDVQLNDLNTKLEQTDSDDKILELMQIAERRKHFVKLRKVIYIFAAIVAGLATAFAVWDLGQVQSRKPSVLIPVSWIDTKSDNMFLVFPVVFVAVAVPLAVIFLSYRISYLLLATGLSLYAGVALYFVYLGNVQYPSIPWYVIPGVLWIVSAGLGLMAEWVDLSESP